MAQPTDFKVGERWQVDGAKNDWIITRFDGTDVWGMCKNRPNSDERSECKMNLKMDWVRLDPPGHDHPMPLPEDWAQRMVGVSQETPKLKIVALKRRAK